MCLDSSKTKQKAFIRDLKFGKDKYVELWKVFDLDAEGNLVAQFHNYNFNKGKNTARGTCIREYLGGKSGYQYEPGFHCFIGRESAISWKKDAKNNYGRERIIKSIKVRKSWITNIGYQDDHLVLVCKHIVI